MGKKRKKDKHDFVAVIVFITAILNLIYSVLELLNQLLE